MTAPAAPTVPRNATAEFRMPSLGADMEFGTLVRWHAAPGARVERGAIIAEVETEKGVFAVESPVSGTVSALVVAEGTKVPVGTVLARFGEEPAAAEPAARPIAQVPLAPAPPLVPRLRASPVARRRAADLGVDLTALWDAGRTHPITLAEVERAAGALAAAPPLPSRVPVAREQPAAPPVPPSDEARAAMRRAVAAAVSRSNREIPHYYLSTSISLRRAMQWLQERNAALPIEQRMLPAALLLTATARALGEHPELNGFWVDDGFRPGEGVHLGVVIALRAGGLVAPAIRDANRKSPAETMRAMSDLVRRSREGGLLGSEMTAATATVTNLGDEGAESVLGVIYPPQVALVGFGRVTERPWAEDGMLGVHPVVTASLAGDHRATDGRAGGRFLATLDRQLQAPEAL